MKYPPYPVGESLSVTMGTPPSLDPPQDDFTSPSSRRVRHQDGMGQVDTYIPHKDPTAVGQAAVELQGEG